MAHQPLEDLKPFRLGSNHTKSFGILAAVGIVLFVLGIALSFMKLPSEQEEAGEPANHEEKGGAVKGEHGDAGHGTMAQYASAQHEAAPAGGAHAEEHAVAGHHEHVIYDSMSAEGTWRRAQWHEDQAIEAHHEREAPGLSAKIGVAL